MAGGTFYSGETKIRPGHYHREESDANTSTASTLNGVGAGLLRANWGPLNEAVEFDLTTKVKTVYGSGYTEDLVTEMFNGGITSGYFVRIGGDDGTAPTITLNDSEGAEAVVITGAYVGDRAFTTTVRESLTNSKKRQLLIYDGTTVFLSVTFDKETGNLDVNEATALVEAINANTSDFIAENMAESSEYLSLALVTQSAFTAGTQPTVTTDSYQAGLDVLEAYDWNCLAVDTEDTNVHEMIDAWLDEDYAAGQFPMACVSECAVDDTRLGVVSLDERMAHAISYNNKMMCYVLNPAYSTTGVLYDGYRNAARIAGMIASVETTTSLTGAAVS